MKFNLGGYSLLMYEVPYICVPTLKPQEMAKEKDIQKLSVEELDNI